MNKTKKFTNYTDVEWDALKKRLLNSCFKYYNANPQKHKTGDCVVRAICAAMDMEWDNVLTDLYKYSLKHKYFMGSEELYEIYLKDLGFTKHKPPRKTNGKSYTLGEWLKDFDKAAIVTINDDHLTYVNDNHVYDIWDCTDEVVNEYWTFE